MCKAHRVKAAKADSRRPCLSKTTFLTKIVMKGENAGNQSMRSEDAASALHARSFKVRYPFLKD